MKIVILAGGCGTRLWPLSRQHKPKQLQALISDQTMLQDTIDRLDFVEPEDIFISTNEEYIPLVKEQIPSIPAENLIAEPACRDTAPCIALAATYLSKKFPANEVMCIVYADHLVQKPKVFREKIQAAAKLAQQENTLNIVEVTAKTPNVNLGYVKVNQKVGTIDGHDIFSLEKFVEKPDLATAKKFLADGNYLWNTGFYVWQIGTILAAFQKHQPETFEIMMQIKDQIDTPNEKNSLDQLYPQCPKISLDYAIMERVNPTQVRIIPADIGWNDIGIWSSIHEETAKTPTDNIIKGSHIGIDTTGSVIYSSSGKTIATIGVNDFIIVETDDAILICPQNRSQDVKKLVEKFKTEKPDLT